jgi:hypothetical protein
MFLERIAKACETEIPAPRELIESALNPKAVANDAFASEHDVAARIAASFEFSPEISKRSFTALDSIAVSLTNFPVRVSQA